MRSGQGSMGEAAEQAQSAVADTAQTVRDTAAKIGESTQEFAAEAGRRASTAAQSLYGTGNDVLDRVEGLARENIGLALLIAGCVGYGLACLVKNAR